MQIRQVRFSDLEHYMTSPDYKELSGGFTTNFVRKVGHQVVKSGPTIKTECNWYRHYFDKADLPQIYCADLGAVTMEFVPSDGQFDLEEVLEIIDKYKDYPPLNDLTFQSYRDRIAGHLSSNPIHGAGKLLKALEQIDLRHTFCHGDLSIDNIIPNKRGAILIDPLYGENFGSYWLDYAKLAFTMKFYRGDVSSYNELMSRTGTPAVLIASECVRVATYRKAFNFISENIINEL